MVREVGFEHVSPWSWALLTLWGQAGTGFMTLLCIYPLLVEIKMAQCVMAPSNPLLRQVTPFTFKSVLGNTTLAVMVSIEYIVFYENSSLSL